MALIKRLFLLIPILFAATSALKAQDRCGTVQYENLLQSLNPSRKNTDQFEEWIKAKTNQARLLQNSERTESSTYIIPVVVHVIHNGEAPGVGGNITDAQVQSQITVLNEDYQRINADAANTPLEFQSHTGSMSIQFVLARQDPNGAVTTGILHVKGTQATWAITDNYQLKSLSYWPAEKYLNIWVTNLASPLLGYAQFPPTDGLTSLQGLDGNTSDRLTDGVAIDYTTFGRGSFSSLVSPFNLGRTATHEIGHFFGLRHIWGDGSCLTDYVNDTPFQTTNTNTCPTSTIASCESADVIAAMPYKAHIMYQDYMDYTNDACMNMFSKGQTDRMDIVINSSPRRMSLLTSPGATVPPSFDLGIDNLVSPTLVTCSGLISPSISVKNFGTTLITSVRVQFSLNGNVLETKDVALNLTSLSSSTVSFSAINFAQATSSQLTFTILSTNGTSDDNSNDNTLTQTVTVPAITDASLAEVFNTVPANWTILNPDGLKTWEITTANNGAADNKAIYINLFNSTYDNDGTTDWLITPVMDFSKVNSALLKFDRAFALYTGATDGLKILVSSNCGSDFSQAVTIFNKSGSALATVNSTSSFTPTGSSQWTTETISLQQFVGQSNIQLAFVVTNGVNATNANRSNNLYLDNVLLTSDAFTDIALTSVSSLSPVICTNNPSPVITIKNNGSSALTSFNLDQTINGTTTTTAYTGLFIQPGEVKTFNLNAFTLITGLNTITLNAKDPNGLSTDALPANNTYTISSVVNTSTDTVPLRQDFEGTFTPAWTIVSQGTQRKWETAKTNKGTSLLYQAFTNTALGSEAWFVSPLLDFSQAQQASLFFDESYGKSAQGNDAFRIMASTDCGVTYPEVVFQRSGDQLSIRNSNTVWSPLVSSDWNREYVELNDLAGKQNVRLAFIVTNNHGNNLYLDNLELYTDADPSPPSYTLRSLASPPAYSIYSSATDPSIVKVTFNLTEKESVRMQVFDIMGQVMMDDELPETLNQTYTVDFTQKSSGVYIVRLQFGNYLRTQKVFVGH